MNALQFQDITTQQINSIGQVIDTVQNKLGELLKGFDDDEFQVAKKREAVFDAEAEFDFDRSKKSQEIADEFLKKAEEIKESEKQSEKSDAEDSKQTESEKDMVGSQ